MSSNLPSAADRGMSSSIPLAPPEPDASPEVQPEPAETSTTSDKSAKSAKSAKGRPAAKSRKKWWIIGVVAAVVIAGLVLFSIMTKPATNNTPTTRQQEVKVMTTTMRTTVSATGTIQPAQRADLSFTSAGTVVTVGVNVGDAVTAGQALAAIDTTDLQSAVDQAQSALNAAWDDYNTAVSTGSSVKINAANSTLKAKQNALDNAKTALSNATLTAPFDGTVAIVNVHVGDKVGSGTSASSSGSGGSGSGGSGSGGNSNVTTGANAASASSGAAITIITADTYQVATSVGSADVTTVKKGQDCTITPDGSTTHLQGTVASVGVIASSSTSAGATFPVVIDITGKQQGLFAGVGASVQIVTSSRDVLAVPTAAITHQNGAEHVQLKTASGIVDTVIKTGATSGGLTEVTSGLKADDVVVITITITVSASTQPGGGFATMFPGGGPGGPGGGGGGRPTGGFSGPVSGGRVTGDAGGAGGQPGGRPTP